MAGKATIQTRRSVLGALNANTTIKNNISEVMINIFIVIRNYIVLFVRIIAELMG